MNVQNLSQAMQALVIAPISSNTTTLTGAAVDLVTAAGEYAFIQSATLSGTDPTLDGKLQDSLDGSTNWADIVGATFTQVTDADTNAPVTQKINVNTDSAKRYVRYVGTIDGTLPVVLLSCVATGLKHVQG